MGARSAFDARGLRRASGAATEADEQLAATAEILHAMGGSQATPQPVFDAIVQNGLRILEGSHVAITLVDGQFVRLCTAGGPLGAEIVREQFSVPISRDSLAGRAILDGTTVNIGETEAAEAVRLTRNSRRAKNFRTVAAAPMMRGEVAIGAVAVLRARPGALRKEQLALLQIFADFAVIAVENARLFKELQARKRELAEALDQRTATAEILRAISSSQSDALPVFQTIARNAVALCGSQFANVFRFDGELLHYLASHNTGPGYQELLRSKYPMRPDLSQVSGRVILSGSVVRLEDAYADPNYDQRFPRAMGWRRMLGVPMLRRDEPIGVIVVGWAESGPVLKAQEELLRIFADQALIAVENVRLIDEIQDKSRKLELANTYKSRFLAVASHDLRQPLHALNLFVAQLQSEADPDEQGRLIKRIDSAVRGLNELFGALLDMSRLEAGVLEPTLTEFPVERIFRNLETTFAGAAREKGLRLKVVSSGAWVRSDFILLERILLNLVSNAVRYTARGGLVVGCRRRGARLRLEVWDSGMGIPEDHRKNIFLEFYRLAGPEPARRGGLGLGLAIVDGLGRLLDHAVELRSRSGKGSCFSVSVPMAPSQRASPTDAQLPPVPIADPLTGKLIVVVDDDALALDGMRGLLQSWGCRAVTEVSAADALARLTSLGEPPDLIISDYRLADGRTGIEAIDCLRGAMGEAIPAFLISGDTATEQLREAGASGYRLLLKPVPPMTLRALLNRLLKSGGDAGESSRTTGPSST